MFLSRIHDLTDPKVRYKVDINAQQYHLTGCIVQSKGINLVVVEGGQSTFLLLLFLSMPVIP